jgi:hypothetical protein
VNVNKYSIEAFWQYLCDAQEPDYASSPTATGIYLEQANAKQLYLLLPVTELRHWKQIWRMGLVGKAISSVDEGFRQRNLRFYCIHKQNSNNCTNGFDVARLNGTYSDAV